MATGQLPHIRGRFGMSWHARPGAHAHRMGSADIGIGGGRGGDTSSRSRNCPASVFGWHTLAAGVSAPDGVEGCYARPGGVEVVRFGGCRGGQNGRMGRHHPLNRSMAAPRGESGVLECWRPRMALRFGHILEDLAARRGVCRFGLILIDIDTSRMRGRFACPGMVSNSSRSRMATRGGRGGVEVPTRGLALVLIEVEGVDGRGGCRFGGLPAPRGRQD